MIRIAEHLKYQRLHRAHTEAELSELIQRNTLVLRAARATSIGSQHRSDPALEQVTSCLPHADMSLNATEYHSLRQRIAQHGRGGKRTFCKRDDIADRLCNHSNRVSEFFGQLLGNPERHGEKTGGLHQPCTLPSYEGGFENSGQQALLHIHHQHSSRSRFHSPRHTPILPSQPLCRKPKQHPVLWNLEKNRINAHRAPMSNKLDEIMAWKREEIARLEPHATEMRKAALRRDDYRGFRQALTGEGVSLIAEVKKASPSAGVICPDFNPVQQSREYEFGGAHCLSILTDEKYFQGHLMDLKQGREQIKLPVLRKDFIVHRNQIYETILSGADCLLLIVAGLDADLLRDLYNEAKDFQLDVLVETHNLREMDAALDLGADLIGINNRNLQSFEVNLETTISLAEEAPPDVLLVSESGIKTRADVEAVAAAGADAILVGETLMRSGSVRTSIRELIGGGDES